MPNLKPSQRTFLEAVQRGDATQDRFSSPYRVYLKGQDRAVPKAIVDAMTAAEYIRFDTDRRVASEVPLSLTDAGAAALTATS